MLCAVLLFCFQIIQSHVITTTARIRRMGKVMFPVCQFMPGGGGGVTPSPSQKTSTGRMPFPEGHPSDCSQFPSGVVPQFQVGYPIPSEERGTPVPSGVPKSQVGGTQSQARDTPVLGYPWLGLGYLLRQNSMVSTCYVADGMPLAFTQEDFLVSECCEFRSFKRSVKQSKWTRVMW